jgi:type IV pilus assembly protein PilC
MKPIPADALASAARQLQYALDGVTTTDQAFEKLYAVADPRQAAALRQLQGLLRSRDGNAAPVEDSQLSPYPTLAWLLDQTPAPERSAAALFSEFSRHQSFCSNSLVLVWSEFSGFLAYLGAVLGVLIAVVLMYGLFVLPQFKSLYGGLGEDLPALTSALFGHGVSVVLFVLMLVTALLVFWYWFVFRLRRQLRRYSPMPAAYQRMPLVGSAVLTYHQYLWLSYAGLLRAAHVPADQALTAAGTRLPLLEVGEWSAAAGGSPTPGRLAASGLVGDLSIAARLGKLDEETGFQQNASMDEVLTALARCRRRSRIMLSILIYLLVAAFVAAMYLPIFSLGSAI